VRTTSGEDGWLLDHLGGAFVAMSFDARTPVPPSVRQITIGPSGDLQDPYGMVAARYGEPGVVYIIRPDQHVAARLYDPTLADLASALDRAQGKLHA
jgi:3-(3-hydroxy-phenyl)propionate hydroxylase